MIHLSVVVDTNVVVSGLITADPQAPTAQVLDRMCEGRLFFLLSVDLLDEYRRVLLRPKIRRYHGLDEGEVDLLLTELALNAAMREPAPATGHDPADAHLWALLDAEPAAFLVTGDQAVLDAGAASGRVMTPRAFLTRLAGGERPPAGGRERPGPRGRGMGGPSRPPI